MDFNTLNMTEYADKGAKMEVRHPVTDAVMPGVTITLLGSDSTELKRRRSAFQRENISKATFEKINGVAMSNRVAAVVSWEGVEENSAPVECTPQNVRSFLEKYDWLVEQIDEFMKDRENFFSPVKKG